nr:alpha-L-fucosidase [uncultured Niameybacter sp.]
MTKIKVKNGVHDYSDPLQYIPPQEPNVQEHIEYFMGLKLGLMMHWAPGCQFGTYESWPLSDGDSSWSQEDIDWTDIETFKQQYIHSNRTFNPVKFRPDKWAKLAKDCGFKYLLFTTKHHDGFCMFDTQTTNYKITDSSCPFHTHPYADIVGSLYEAFRKEGLAISTYFSKPDWHSDYYWHKAFGTAKTRNVNYTIKEHPELWEKFVEYTHSQIEELCTKYGKIDVLWLDGGWVNPNNLDQDIDLPTIVNKIRTTTQPHLIVCDRTVGGPFENIITPEKTIPETALDVPWETCTTLGQKFSFHYTDTFKTGLQLVHLLLDIVCKGGNLALNVAPQPDGELPKPAVLSMKQLGAWLNIFGEGIYNTHIVAPYFNDRIKYTAKDNMTYAFYLYDEIPLLPHHITLHSATTVKTIHSIRTKELIPFEQHMDTITLNVSSLHLQDAFYAEGFVLVHEGDLNN